jgi:capsular exopolysaccharide synthesis family protein
VLQARSALTRVEDELEEESERLTTEHPTIKALQADVAEASADLQREERAAYDAVLLSARSSFNAASSAESRIQQMVSGQRGRSAQEADDYAQLDVLRTSLANKRRVLQQFIDQRESTELSSRLYGIRGSSARVVDWATLPRVPSGQPLSRVMFSYALFGLLLGCAMAIVLDFMDSTLRSADDVARRVRLPMLGSVTSLQAARSRKGKYYSRYSYSESTPALDTTLPAELIAHQQPRSALAEEYRELRTALLLSTAGGAPRRLLLTSSQPGEGKTTTTCNLAISMAQAGKKVLLVDGDLRRPRLEKIFGREDAPGLANYLAGSAPWEELILDTEVPNLWLLPSGPIPPNPAELYAGDLYGLLTTEVLDSFDLLMVDSPPIDPVVDSLMLAQHADGVVMIVKAGATPHHAVSRARRKLEQVRARLVGIVLNQVHAGGRGAKYYARYEYKASKEGKTAADKSGSRATN